jgi:hypothetical protein
MPEDLNYHWRIPTLANSTGKLEIFAENNP